MNDLRGKFIVLDGPEGCGKSTQAELLMRRARAQDPALSVTLVRDPGATRIGELVRGILLDPANVEMSMRCEMLLYMAARAQLMAQRVLPALGEGQLVISDRFVSSTLAYQLVAGAMTERDIRAVADVAIAGRWPDRTVILDLPLEASHARLQGRSGSTRDRIEQRPAAYHHQVRMNYLAQAHADPEHYRVVSAAGAVEAVHEAIWEAVVN